MMTEVPIGKRMVPVEYVSVVDYPDLHGKFLCDAKGPRILIVQEADAVQRAETLAHEITHAWLYFTGVHNVLKAGHEELLCDAFAPYLTQLLNHVARA